MYITISDQNISQKHHFSIKLNNKIFVCIQWVFNDLLSVNILSFYRIYIRQ